MDLHTDTAPVSKPPLLSARESRGGTGSAVREQWSSDAPLWCPLPAVHWDSERETLRSAWCCGMSTAARETRSYAAKLQQRACGRTTKQQHMQQSTTNNLWDARETPQQ